MSWAAHQFEVYAVHAHLPAKMRGRVSFIGIWLGDFTPDFVAKFWVYGFTVGGVHYGAAEPQRWHRGWPGVGFTHTVGFGLLLGLLLWVWKRDRALTVGFVLGLAAHAVTDVHDSVGTMMLFPFWTGNFSVETWAYSATADGGKYLDAAAYYSSLGLAMDVLWLVVALCSWRVLTEQYWRSQVVAAEPARWAWLGRFLPERGLLALYRATFFYGVTRLIAWNTWVHLIARPVIDGVERVGYPFDLSWTGPWWMPAQRLPGVHGIVVLPLSLLLLAAVYGLVTLLWTPMGRAERTTAARERDRSGGGQSLRT